MKPKTNLSDITYTEWQMINRLLRRHFNPYTLRLAVKKLLNIYLELEEIHDLLALGDLNSPGNKAMLLEALSDATTALEVQKQYIYDIEEAINLR